MFSNMPWKQLIYRSTRTDSQVYNGLLSWVFPDFNVSLGFRFKSNNVYLIVPRFPLLYDYASVDAREQSSPQCRPIRFFVWPVRYATKIASKGTRPCCDPVSHLKIADLQAHSAAHFTVLSACSSDGSVKWSEQKERFRSGRRQKYARLQPSN